LGVENLLGSIDSQYLETLIKTEGVRVGVSHQLYKLTLRTKLSLIVSEIFPFILTIFEACGC